MKIKINKNFDRYKTGQTVCIPDNNGLPLDLFWRRRLKDSEIDECCSIILEEKEKPKIKKAKDNSIVEKGVK